MKDLLRKRLYALQQRLALTGPEALALLGIATILALGGLVNHVESRRSPVQPGAYELLDATVAEGASRVIEDTSTRGAESSEGEPVSATAPARTAAASAGGLLPPVRLDPNTASPALLQRLPGIGPALAERIVEYRQTYGPFRSAREITRVRGIGPKTYERLAPYLHVWEPPAGSSSTTGDQDRAGGSSEPSGSAGAPSPP
jgi:competence ComEA-like helix-hairpin-helix protein